MLEKTSIVFVGIPLRSATNWFVAKKGGGHYQAPYTAFCANKRDSVRIRKLADSRYTCTCFTFHFFDLIS